MCRLAEIGGRRTRGGCRDEKYRGPPAAAGRRAARRAASRSPSRAPRRAVRSGAVAGLPSGRAAGADPPRPRVHLPGCHEEQRPAHHRHHRIHPNGDGAAGRPPEASGRRRHAARPRPSEPDRGQHQSGDVAGAQLHHRRPGGRAGAPPLPPGDHPDPQRPPQRRPQRRRARRDAGRGRQPPRGARRRARRRHELRGRPAGEARAAQGAAVAVPAAPQAARLRLAALAGVPVRLLSRPARGDLHLLSRGPGRVVRLHRGTRLPRARAAVQRLAERCGGRGQRRAAAHGQRGGCARSRSTSPAPSSSRRTCSPRATPRR